MALAQDQRPRYFEGQYLGAEDLSAAVAYGRVQDARHALGAHSWGIAIGLTLKETPLPGGAVDVYIMPGYAWDGFGRPIVVLAPARVPPGLFDAVYKFDPAIDIGTKGRLIEVWLRYDETATQNPRPGFEVCDTDDQRSRIQETYRIEIGPQPSHVDRHDPLSIAGQLVDAQQALQRLDPAAPLIYDESIPHQHFPEEGERVRWLIPIGYVRWLPVQNAPGHFVARDDSDPSPPDPNHVKDSDKIARFRRYIGVVAERVDAVDGAIRLRDRAKDPDDPANTRFSKNPPKSFFSKDSSKGYYQAPTPDLVWVEGHLRVEGDARITKGRLDFRAPDGMDHDTPLLIQRAGDAGKAPTQTGDRAIQVLLGPVAQTDNRFAVGPLKDDGTLDEKLVVRSGGNVGIGTSNPSLKLDIEGDFGRDGGPATLHLWGARIGDVGNGVLFVRAFTGGVVAMDGTNNRVGIGTNAPDRALTIQGNAGTYLNVKADGGAHEVLLGADGNGGIVSTMTNHDLQLRAGGNNTHMVIKADGSVGIGTNTPAMRLDIQGDFGRNNGAATMSLWGSRIGDVGGGVLFVRAALGGIVAMDGTNNLVGIGTSAPATKLHVLGDRIRLQRSDGRRLDMRVDGGAVDLHSETTKLYLRSSGPGVNNQIIMNPFAGDGTVSIGTENPDPNYNLYVAGDAFKTSGLFWDFISDVRLKRNVETLTGVLDRLLQLRGTRYEWSDPEKMGSRAGPQMGLVAQEVESVFPEWVKTGPEGYKMLSMQGFEAVVIESLRELKAVCDRLDARLQALEKKTTRASR